MSKNEISLRGAKFLQRFCQHILPLFFQRIRYYGLYAFSNKALKEKAFELISAQPLQAYQKAPKKQLLEKMLGIDPEVCPDCACYQTLILLPLTADASQYFRWATHWAHPAVKLRPSPIYNRVVRLGNQLLR